MTNFQSHDGGLTTPSAFINTQVLVASGTGTVAGVDLRDFIGDIKLLLTVSQQSAGAGCQISLLHSTDNTTFVTWAAAPTFTNITGATSLQSVSLDTRTCNRFVQGKHIVTGTTGSFAIALIGVGTKQSQ